MRYTERKEVLARQLSSDDFDDRILVQWNWSAEKLTTDEMFLKIDFDRPLQVSASSQDIIFLRVKRPEYFLTDIDGEQHTFIEKDYRVEYDVP